VVALGFLLLVELALALEGEGAVLDFDLNVFHVHPWKVGLDREFVVGFENVHSRGPRGARRGAR
jgi:hypothetical protein